MKPLWQLIKWSFRYDPTQWPPMVAFMKLWLIVAAAIALLVGALFVMNGFSFPETAT